MPSTVHKVTCFIIRRENQLLLLRHPNVGIQIPAGTVNPGEEIESAAQREAREESGLTSLVLLRSLGQIDDQPPPGYIFTAYPTPVYSRPHLLSYDWVHFRTGLPVEVVRHEAGFTQVKFEETDRYINPQYATYSILGWVPDEALTTQRIRHFFLFTAPDPTLEQWSVEVDYTRFELFWSPLNHLPEIVPPQASWLKWIKGIE
jgi:8-oxo-dGTP pyrophosphatase MutT (NUDIX family)